MDLGPTVTLAPLPTRLRDGESNAQSELYQSLFGPLDNLINNLKTVFVAPDGPLDLVSFAHRSPAAALRKTQLDWIGDGDARKRDPKYWAPFVLVERG